MHVCVCSQGNGSWRGLASELGLRLNGALDQSQAPTEARQLSGCGPRSPSPGCPREKGPGDGQGWEGRYPEEGALEV